MRHSIKDDILKYKWVEPQELLDKWYDSQLSLFALHSTNNPLLELIGQRELKSLCLNFKWYYDTEDLKVWYKNKEKAVKNTALINELNIKSREYTQEAIKLIRKLEKAKMIDIDLMGQARKVLINLWNIFMIDLGKYIAKEIDLRLSKQGFSKNQISQIKNLYFEKNPKLAFQKGAKELVLIANKYKKTKDKDWLEKTVGLYRDKYAWLSVNEIDTEPFTAQDYLKEVLELIKTDRLTKKMKSTAKKTRVTFSLNPENKKYLETVYQHIYLDNYAADLYARLNYLAQELIRQQYELSFKDQSWYSFDELQNLVKTGTKLLSQDIEKRKKHRVMVQINNKIKVSYDRKIFDNISGKISSKSIKKPSLIKGQTACMGYAKGIVKIVLGVKDIDKVKEGDILVAQTTRPDLVIAMRRSAAIVTDSGGITSHAAIVSREFGIPCIVGTNIATIVLKDGDLVKVDANRGIIRIM